MMQELSETYLRRSSSGAAPGVVELLRLYLAHTFYSPYLWPLLGYALVSAVLFRTLLLADVVDRLWGDLRSARRLAGDLLLSVGAGAVVTASILRGYFTDGFVQTYFPFLGFGIAAAWGVVVLDAAALGSLAVVSFRRCVPFARAVPVAVALVLTVQNSAREWWAFPPLSGGVMATLSQPQWHDRPIVAPVTANVLAHIMTNGRSADVPALATPERLRATAAVLATDRLLYLCLHRPWFGVDCPAIRTEFEARGYTTLATGRDYFLAELRP
jgi:hypothetical protein